jgi:hypothetical protein
MDVNSAPILVVDGLKLFVTGVSLLTSVFIATVVMVLRRPG